MMLDLSIHSGAESEALGAAFCVLGILPGEAERFVHARERKIFNIFA